jgi:hypothetical protein
VNSLPAKGLARVLSEAALVGCALSVLVHLIALLGFHSKALLSFQLGLFLGLVPMAIPTFLAQERLLSKLSFLDRVRKSHVAWKVIVAKTPRWLRRTFATLGCYAMASFVVFLFRNFSTKIPSDHDELWIMSVYAAAFYSAYAAILTSYVESERPLRLDEI